MKLRLEIGSDVTTTFVKDGAGTITAIEFVPLFTRRKGQATVLYGEATNDKHQTIDRFALTVSGATGKLQKIDRLAPVVAAVDRDDSDEDTDEEDDGNGKKD